MPPLRISGPNLEVVKFGLYMFFPIWIMFKFGDPVWYDDNVKPYKDVFWPAYETTHRPPKSQEGVREKLAEMKAEKMQQALRRRDGGSDGAGGGTGGVGGVQEGLRSAGVTGYATRTGDRLV